MNLDHFVVWLKERGVPDNQVPIFRTAAARLLAQPGARTRLTESLAASLAEEEAKGNPRRAAQLREAAQLLLAFHQAQTGETLTLPAARATHARPSPLPRVEEPSAARPEALGSNGRPPPERPPAVTSAHGACPRCGGAVELVDFTQRAQVAAAVAGGAALLAGFLGGFLGGLAGGGCILGGGALYAALTLEYRCGHCNQPTPSSRLSAESKQALAARRHQHMLRGVGLLLLGTGAACVWLWLLLKRG